MSRPLYNYFYDKLESLIFWRIVYNHFKHLAPRKGERRVFVGPPGKSTLTAKEAYKRAVTGIIQANLRHLRHKTLTQYNSNEPAN